MNYSPEKIIIMMQQKIIDDLYINVSEYENERELPEENYNFSSSSINQNIF